AVVGLAAPASAQHHHTATGHTGNATFRVTLNLQPTIATAPFGGHAHGGHLPPYGLGFGGYGLGFGGYGGAFGPGYAGYNPGVAALSAYPYGLGYGTGYGYGGAGYG